MEDKLIPTETEQTEECVEQTQECVEQTQECVEQTQECVEQTQEQTEERIQEQPKEQDKEQPREDSAPGKSKKRWFDILLILGVLLIVGAGGALLWLEANNNESKDIYENLKDQFVSTYPGYSTEAGNSSAETNETEQSVTEETTTSTGDGTEESSTEDSEESSMGESEESSSEVTSTEAPTESTADESSEQATGPVEEELVDKNAETWHQMIRVNFDGLRQINPDVVGWVFFENIDLSYPILYSEEEGKYLRTDIYGQTSTAGCIYLDGQNSSDFEDRRSVIYGHNMKNLTMFGKLKYYVQDRNYYGERQYFQILKDGVIYRYRIFSFFPVNQNETPMVRVTYYENDDVEFEFLLGQLKERSIYGETGVEVNVDDHILTLVTCFTEGHRVLINAVRVDSYPLQ